MREPIDLTSYIMRMMGQLGREDTAGLPPVEEEPGPATDNLRAFELLANYRNEAAAIPSYRTIRPATLASGRAVLEAELALQIAFIHEALARLTTPQRLNENTQYDFSLHHLKPLLSQLTKRQLPYAEGDIVQMIDRLARLRSSRYRHWDVHLQGFLHAIATYVAARGMSAPVETALRGLRVVLQKDSLSRYDEGRKELAQLAEILDGRPTDDFALDTRDEWGPQAIAALEELDPATRSSWQVLLRHAASAEGSRPAGVWLKTARSLIDELDEARFVDLAVTWFELLRQSRRNAEPERAFYQNAAGYRVPTAVIAEKNGDVLKGLAWCSALVGGERVAAALGDAADACFKKIPEIGARSTKVGNACVYALGALPGTAGVAQLVRLEQRIKLPSTRKMIESALDGAAKRNGLTRRDLDELTTPTFGLVDGRVTRTLGDYVAEVAVAGPERVAATWRDGAGKVLRTEPADVKRSFPDERKALKRLVDDVRATLAAQRERLEALFLNPCTWSVSDWRTRYLDHPLLSVLARRLIWTFESGGRTEIGGWLDGRIVDERDQAIESIGTDTVVRLWHPLGWDPTVVLAWREWLERHEITQPFKQAHREIYVLTDAERATATYSNRFAAHLVRQHQLSALCQQRGWRYRLRGAWDGANHPTLELPTWGLRVAFWCEGVEDPEHTAASGIFLYLSTDQVRFSRLGTTATVPLTEVPALVFSETMRDVDLFVGVGSVGTDPTWRDEGLAGYRDYWEHFAFGDLSATAQTRRATLEHLLPRLTKLAERWTLTDRFLVVRGNRRTYKIHLGSGNILMEPNDQYLCIVPRGGGELGSDQIFLPFEGDSVLAVILSKAFLLAADDTIKDPTILRQIV
jgi:hypothetical protein